MPSSVGTFGGYTGRAIDWRPDRNGLLTCVVEGPPSSLRLLWSFAGSGSFVLGEAVLPKGPQRAPSAAIRGWVTLERREDGIVALVSRAWPAVRLVWGGGVMLWRTSATRLLGVIDGRA